MQIFLISHSAKIQIHSDKLLANEALQHLPLWTGMLQHENEPHLVVSLKTEWNKTTKHLKGSEDGGWEIPVNVFSLGEMEETG